jgi:hypothetical protein
MVWEVSSHTMVSGGSRMKTGEISSTIASSAQPFRKYASPRTASSIVPPQNAFKGDTVRKPQLDHIHFNKIEASNALAADISLMIRKVNQSMEAISSHLEEMRTSLESVVKIYPPYPPGSSERIEALRKFSALRNMIDQITQPNTALGMQKILGDPAANSQAGDWTMQISDKTADLVVRHQPAHSGKTGLNLPDIATDSSDNYIRAVIGQIDSAIETLAIRRQHFIADANLVIDRI